MYKGASLAKMKSLHTYTLYCRETFLKIAYTLTFYTVTSAACDGRVYVPKKKNRIFEIQNAANCALEPCNALHYASSQKNVH